jgi:trans-aconitate methyltransferase
MDNKYYAHVRSEIATLLPATATRIVDVGCGAGATLAWLRQRYPAAYTIGLEGNAALEPQLTKNVSEFHIVDLNGDLPDLGAPDLMLFLDVLEHLPDPSAVLCRLTAQLAPGGCVIVSVPNIAHLSVSLPLLLAARFTYADAGILDRTHMRFFVQDSAVQLVSDADLVVDRGLLGGIDGPRSRLVDVLTFHKLRSRLAKNFIVRGVRATPRSSSGPITWNLAASASITR